ncbi:hypothetical protein PINS_up013333 [Pythium insidiosum]|nr:hypothetical protein PINS_up013333 [Pythium insidiosum]
MAHGVQVSCRVRPPDAGSAASSGSAVSLLAPTTVCVDGSHASEKAPTTFSFDSVFGPETTQRELFDAVGEPLVRHVLDGFHCALLAYGQSGSGKTFTAFGGDSDAGDDDGLVPRLLDRFVAVCGREGTSEGDSDATLTASFVEIYQERLVDLLCPNKASARLRVREDRATDSVWVDGAAEVSLTSSSVARQLVRRGLRHRASGATRLNDRSSRSHAVLTITLTRTRRSGSDDNGGADPTSSSSSSSTATTTTTLRSRLCIADLAGSESVHKSAAQGQRLEEAKHINRVGLVTYLSSGSRDLTLETFWFVPVTIGAGERDLRAHVVGFSGACVRSVPRQQAHTVAAVGAWGQRSHAPAADVLQRRSPHGRDAVNAALRSTRGANGQRPAGQRRDDRHRSDDVSARGRRDAADAGGKTVRVDGGALLLALRVCR